VALADAATADVNEPETPGADVLHKRFHAHIELGRCLDFCEQRLVGERAVFHSETFLLSSSSTAARSQLDLASSVPLPPVVTLEVADGSVCIIVFKILITSAFIERSLFAARVTSQFFTSDGNRNPKGF
jgi:hypothetical protein